MTTLIMPMAGAGSRFAQAGYTDPKPFIKLGGRALFIQAYMDACSVLGKAPTKSIFLVREEHLERAKAEFTDFLAFMDHESVQPSVQTEAVFVPVPELTDGAASTVQLAGARVAPYEDVLVTNCDQHVEVRPSTRKTFEELREHGHPQAVVLCFTSNGEKKWSYLDHGFIYEKPDYVPFRKVATCGLYWFKTAQAMFDAIGAMKLAGRRTNGEFYFAPCINFMETFPYALFVDGFEGLGTPEDLQRFTGGVR